MKITTILSSIFYRKRDRIAPTNEEVICNVILESTTKNDEVSVSLSVYDVFYSNYYILPVNSMKDTEENQN